MNEKKLTPDIRFTGFKDKWSISPLGNISKIYDGTHQTPNYTKSGVMFLSVENIETLTSNKFISKDDFKQDFNVYPQFGDILMTRIGTIGKAKVFGHMYPVAYYVTLALIKPIDINSYFLESNINSSATQQELWFRTLHIAFPKKINMNEIEKVKISYPTMSEQQKIGKYFKEKNSNIESKKEELKKLKQFKQAMLQKMFPKEGEAVPEVRFEEFDGEWKKYELGEIADIVGGGTPSTSISTYWDGDIDWYSPVEIGDKIYVDSSQKKITKDGLDSSSAKLLPVGTILFTSRAGIGKTAILTKEGTTNQGFQSIVPHKDVLDTYFIYSRTEELKQYGENKGAGSTFIEVSGKQMEKMPILIPTLNEQKQIGTYFKILDNLITTKQAELTKLKQFKQAMLDKMFV